MAMTMAMAEKEGQGDDAAAVRKDSNGSRKPKRFGMFSRGGLKRLGSITQGEEGLITKNVALRESTGGKEFKGGKKYLQIAVDSKEMLAWDNLDANMVNYRHGVESTEEEMKKEDKTIAAVENGMAQKATQERFALGALEPVRNVENYDLGIAKQYPHLVVGSGKPKLRRESGSKTKESRGGKMKMKQGPRHDREPSARDFALKRPTASSSSEGVLYGNIPGPTNVAFCYAPVEMPALIATLGTSDRDPDRNSASESRSPVPKSPVPAPVPASIPLWPGAPMPKTPQHSAQNSAEVAISPSVDKHSISPSVLSATDSIQSDAESGIIMNAQNAEFVRAQDAAGYYVGGVRKPPKPGPAPTRALPSLPEGHDAAASALRRPKNFSQGRTSIESALERSSAKGPPISPTRRYRYSPIKTPTRRSSAVAVETEIHVPFEPGLLDSPNISPATRTITPSPGGDPSGNNMSPITMEQKQVRRVRSIKALKKRDIERFRERQERLDGGRPELMDCKGKTDDEEIIMLPPVSDAYSFRSFLPMIDNEASRLSGLSLHTTHDRDQGRAASGLSPIIVIAEQEPTITATENHILCKGDHWRDQGSMPNDAKASGGSNVEDAIKNLPRLSLSSPDTATPTNGTKESQPVHGETHLQHYPTLSEQGSRRSMNATDIEARFEARIQALERKNSLLQRLFMAVLDTSPTLGPSNSDRSSGLSATSSLFAMEAKVDALLTLVQENKRMSAGL